MPIPAKWTELPITIELEVLIDTLCRRGDRMTEAILFERRWRCVLRGSCSRYPGLLDRLMRTKSLAQHRLKGFDYHLRAKYCHQSEENGACLSEILVMMAAAKT